MKFNTDDVYKFKKPKTFEELIQNDPFHLLDKEHQEVSEPSKDESLAPEFIKNVIHNNSYYHALDNTEFCVNEDIDSFLNYLGEEPDEILNDQEKLKDLSDAYMVYANNHSYYMKPISSAKRAYDLCKERLEYTKTARLIDAKFEVLGSYLRTEDPQFINQSKRTWHEAEVFTGSHNIMQCEVQNKLVWATDKFTDHLPEFVKKAILDIHKINGIDEPLEFKEISKERTEFVQQCLDEPEKFFKKYNKLSQYQKIKLFNLYHQDLLVAPGSSFIKKFNKNEYCINIYNEFPDLISINKATAYVDDFVNNKVSAFLERNDCGFEKLINNSLDHKIIKIDDLELNSTLNEQKQVNTDVKKKSSGVHL